jgi:hypothetical protein
MGFVQEKQWLVETALGFLYVQDGMFMSCCGGRLHLHSLMTKHVSVVYVPELAHRRLAGEEQVHTAHLSRFRCIFPSETVRV